MGNLRCRRRSGSAPRWPARLLGRQSDGYDPFQDPSLRAAWVRNTKFNSTPSALLNGETAAAWNDFRGVYNANVANGTATGSAVGANNVVTIFPNGSGTLNTGSITIPTDSACTIAFLAQTGSTQISARDYDALICFSNLAAVANNKWMHFCLRRLAAPSLWIGFASSNAGAGYSGWIASTTQLSVSTWYRWIWVLDGSSMRMYVNGTNQSFTQDVSTGGPTEGQFLNTANVDADCITLMGRRRNSGYDEQWTGRHDFGFWFSRSYSAADVASLDSWLSARQTELA